MHYTPSDTAYQDKTRIGLVFAEKAPQYEVKVAGIVSRLSAPQASAKQGVPLRDRCAWWKA
jgi:hypothetical protein